MANVKKTNKKSTPAKAASVKTSIIHQQQIEDTDMKIYQYLKKQLQIKRAQLKAIEAPLDPQKVKDERYVQELILKSNIWQLEDELNAIEMILGING